MLRPRSLQASFLDTDAICAPLLPPDSFHRRFRDLVWPLIKDEQFEPLYCQANGRPAISPALLAMATILQFHEDLSDREMEDACRYDIRIKYALGLAIDERPFDHSSLGDFRDRLLRHRQEKAVFDQIVQKLVDLGLIEKHEPQRIDATHIIADIAIPSMITMVKKGVRDVLKPLAKHHGGVLDGLSNLINLDQYSREQVNQNGPGRMDLDRRKTWLVEVVNDARAVIDQVKGIQGDPILARRVDTLRRILHENIEAGADGAPKEKAYKSKPKDLLVSPIDADARYGAKSATKHFVGYKANLTETVGSRFITNVVAMAGNRPDGATMVEAVTGQIRHGLKPIKVIGDTAYSDGAYRRALKGHGALLVAPLRAANHRTRSVFPKSMFRHDEVNNTLTCPAGAVAPMTYYDSFGELKVFHFPITACSRCELKSKCTHASEGRRTVGISAANRELREAEIYNRTPAFREDMKCRCPIEGRFSELKRYHGLARARYRGLRKVGLQCYFSAAVLNLKRLVKLLTQGVGPPLSEARTA
jgi:transposase